MAIKETDKVPKYLFNCLPIGLLTVDRWCRVPMEEPLGLLQQVFTDRMPFLFPNLANHTAEGEKRHLKTESYWSGL